MIVHGPQPKADKYKSKSSRRDPPHSHQNPTATKSKFDPSNPKQDYQSIDFLSNLEFTESSHDDDHNSLPVNICDITPQKIQLDIIPPTNHISIKKVIQIMNKLHPMQHEVPEKRASTSETGINTGIQLYKIWPGNNRFWFDGRIMAGPKTDMLTNMITWTLLIAVSSLFFGTAAPYLWRNGNISLPLISAFLFMFCVGFLLLASYTNPGIIPRKAVWEINGEVPYPYNGNKRENSGILSARDIDALEEEGRVRINKNNNLKLCRICNIYKPPRAAHCKDCGNCVEVFVHHSHFLNNCIGKRNYKYFLGFLVSMGLLGAGYLSGFLIMLIASIGNDDDLNINTIAGNDIVSFAIILILGIPAGVLFIFVVAFTGFHWWIVYKEKTGKEKLKGIIDREDLRSNAVDWCLVEPVFFDIRQPINQEQLLKFWRHMPRDGL